MWTSFYGSTVRLQDLDFDRKQLKVVQGKERRPLCTTFNSFNPDYKNTSKPKTKITFSTASL
jgi:hypothetical protein